MTEPTVVLHAGAGNYNESAETQRVIQDDLDAISRSVVESLTEEDEFSAIDAVEQAVNAMEANPDYNAGYGSKLQLDGVPRPEASIMTSDGEIGCVTGLEGIEPAISVARDVMDDLPNCFIGNGFATEFAIHHGYPKKSLVTDERREEWEALYEQLDGEGIYEKVFNMESITGSGTVGCVALDSDGRLCAGTSTGGRVYQFHGRIGDSPLIGSGTYCNEHIGVSCTGVGEAILQTQLARMCDVHYRSQSAIDEGVAQALSELDDDYFAGVIAVTSEGEVSCQYTSDAMRYSVATA